MTTHLGDITFTITADRSDDDLAEDQSLFAQAVLCHTASVTPGIVLTDEFTAALDLLDSGRHLFLTGKAGTGKSTLIRHFMAGTDRQCLVVAPTGIAALNVDGYTIHRLLSFHPGITVDEVRHGRYYPGRFAAALKQLDVLIVDEASMVRADLFDCLAAALERFGPHPGQPFGGVQLVLVGDLFQLPPVVTDGEKAHLASTYPTPYFFSAQAFQGNEFATVQLTRVFRQAGDSELTDILNAIREGTISDSARARLNERTTADFVPPEGELWLTLATTNLIADARNKRALERLPGPIHESVATITGDLDQAEAPTERRLRYAVGAQVMLLVNDPGDEFANGTLGLVTAIGTGSDGEPLVTIATRDGREVTVGPHRWEVTRPVVEGGAIRHEVVGTFTQLPFRLAWAITIHKSQGQTVDRLVVDLSGGTFAYGQLYVALSRCTSMEGLVLQRDVIPKDLKTDQRVRRFLAAAVGSAEAPPVYLGICSVGHEGQRTRPRPVEIALVTDDGTEVSTLVNPESDLYEARSELGICAADVVAAPRLAEAWPALTTWLAGRVPVGVDVDRELGYIDFELKRNGFVEPMPLSISLDPRALTPQERAGTQAGSALERARAVRAAAARLSPADDGAEPFPASDRPGFLLPRGATLDQAILAAHAPEASAGLLAQARARKAAAASDVDLAAVLVPGARVCFTGTVLDASGRTMDRAAMEALARAGGLAPVGSVTRTRCDVLVCAEVGSQSGKARKAAELGKPIVLATDFLEWAGGPR